MATSEEAIASLVHAYAERIDAGDLEGVAGLFADATYRSARGVYEGGEAVLALLRRRVILHDGTPLTKHVITNLSIEVVETADTASARSYYTVLQATPALGLHRSSRGATRIASCGSGAHGGSPSGSCTSISSAT